MESSGNNMLAIGLMLSRDGSIQKAIFRSVSSLRHAELAVQRPPARAHFLQSNKSINILADDRTEPASRSSELAARSNNSTFTHDEHSIRVKYLVLVVLQLAFERVKTVTFRLEIDIIIGTYARC